MGGAAGGGPKESDPSQTRWLQGKDPPESRQPALPSRPAWWRCPRRASPGILASGPPVSSCRPSAPSSSTGPGRDARVQERGRDEDPA